MQLSTEIGDNYWINYGSKIKGEDCMWINFINLNGGDIEEQLKGEEERESCSMLVQPVHVLLRKTLFGKVPGWVVHITTQHGPDPKIHFTDQAKAIAKYEQLCGYITGASDDAVFYVNALEYGAI